MDEGIARVQNLFGVAQRRELAVDHAVRRTQARSVQVGNKEGSDLCKERPQDYCRQGNNNQAILKVPSLYCRKEVRIHKVLEFISEICEP